MYLSLNLIAPPHLIEEKYEQTNKMKENVKFSHFPACHITAAERSFIYQKIFIEKSASACIFHETNLCVYFYNLHIGATMANLLFTYSEQ